jgi:hypothetical protein
LPASGRSGDTPAWALAGGQTPDEARLWDELWHSPQAVAWEDLGWTRSVARYARAVVLAETGANASLLAEVRQMEDRLGLNPMSMKRLQWEIVDTPTSADDADVPNIEDYRDRLAR